MSSQSSSRRTQNHVDINWPGYVWRFAGLMLSLLLIAAGLLRESNNLVLLGMILSLFFIILLGVSLWALNRGSKISADQTVDYLYKLSQTRTSDTLAYIDLGYRWPAIAISRHLTSGQINVIDIYNPQRMPAKSLIRARQSAPAALIDPRLDWYDSNLELLPLPDGSVNAVFLYHVLSEVAQQGDQQALLREIYRIMAPNGRLLVAEMANSWPNRLRPGSVVLNLHPQDHWIQLLTAAGFDVRRSQTLQGVTFCVRADKPSPFAGQQLSLDLDFETVV